MTLLIPASQGVGPLELLIVAVPLAIVAGIIWLIVRVVRHTKPPPRTSTPPAVVPPPPPPAAPAGWHADPSGRFQRRYYDGTTWTSHVQLADGTTGEDQPTPRAQP